MYSANPLQVPAIVALLPIRPTNQSETREHPVSQLVIFERGSEQRAIPAAVEYAKNMTETLVRLRESE
jgi:hypothetical protein